MALFKPKKSKKEFSFVGAYLPDKLVSHMNLYVVVNNISKTDFLQKALEQVLQSPTNSIHELSKTIVARLFELDKDCSIETKESITLELLQKGVDKAVITEILKQYEKK